MAIPRLAALGGVPRARGGLRDRLLSARHLAVQSPRRGARRGRADRRELRRRPDPGRRGAARSRLVRHRPALAGRGPVGRVPPRRGGRGAQPPGGREHRLRGADAPAARRRHGVRGRSRMDPAGLRRAPVRVPGRARRPRGGDGAPQGGRAADRRPDLVGCRVRHHRPRRARRAGRRTHLHGRLRHPRADRGGCVRATHSPAPPRARRGPAPLLCAAVVRVRPHGLRRAGLVRQPGAQAARCGCRRAVEPTAASARSATRDRTCG